MRIPGRHVTTFAQTADPKRPAGGGDPFGIAHPSASEAYVRALDAVDLALDGMDGETAARVTHSLHVAWGSVPSFDPSHTPLDLATARLIASLDVDPLAALWFATLRTGAMPVLREDADDDDAPFVLRIHPREQVLPEGRTPGFEGTVCRIGDDILWNQRGSLRVPAMPHALVAALRGRPLGDLLRHPVLDDLRLLVTEAGSDGDWTVVRTDHRATAAGLGDLMRIAPQGCR